MSSHEAGVEGSECCILEICCGGSRQIEELAKKLNDRVDGINLREATRVAEYIIQMYDLAPAGTLRPFKRAIAEMARKYEPDPGY